MSMPCHSIRSCCVSLCSALPITQGYLQHATYVTNKDSAERDMKLKGAKIASAEYVGSLANEDAPPSSYFSVTCNTNNSMTLSRVCGFPEMAEPGEQCSMLLLPLDDFLHLNLDASLYDMYFMGCYLTGFGPVFRSNFTALIFLARRGLDTDFAERYGTKIDPENNSVLYREALNENPPNSLSNDSDTGFGTSEPESPSSDHSSASHDRESTAHTVSSPSHRWKMASRVSMQLDGEHVDRPMRIVVSVGGEVDFNSYPNRKWTTVYRHHPVRFVALSRVRSASEIIQS